MEATCHTSRERKSKSLDKIKKESKMRKGHVAWRRWEEISHLNQVGSIRWGEGKRRERKRKKKKKGVRSSTFSLRFTEIVLSVFVGARNKVRLREESFA